MGMLVGTRRALVGGRKFNPVDCTYAEYVALKALYIATHGASWTDNTGWLTDTTVNNWFGVTTAGGVVTVVTLNGNNLVGSLSSWDVGDLPNLTNFQLAVNALLTGDISGWTLPASLVNFRINFTSVSGDISGWTLPASLQYFYVNAGKVRNLHYLNVVRNTMLYCPQ